MKRQPNHIELEKLDVFNMMLKRLNRKDLLIDEVHHWDSIGKHFSSSLNKIGQQVLFSENQIDIIDSDGDLIEQVHGQLTDVMVIGMAGYFTLDQ